MLSGVTGWHFLLLIALIAFVVVVLLAWRVKRARTSGDPTPVVAWTLGLAAFYAGLCVISAVVGFLSTLMSPAVRMAVPVQQYWPLPLPGLTVTDGPTAPVVDGGFTTAELALENLSPATRILWASGQSLGTLVPAAIAGLIALACFQLLRGAAFAPVVARAAMITAAVVLVGGFGAQILSDVAGSMASREALEITAAEFSGYPDEFDVLTFLPQPALAVSVDFWPIGAALGFAALASVFRFGTRLQTDTELLV
jgi:hypothetical protein